MDNINIPEDFDYQHWIKRWDKMQEFYVASRSERFDVIRRIIADTQDSVKTILDIGCGTGSLMVEICDAFQKARVVGIDFDPTMLLLANARIGPYKERAKTILLDIRDQSWLKAVPDTVDAVISATALHWLKPAQLEIFYKQIGGIIRAGGIFINADHVGSEYGKIQKSWERHKNIMREQEDHSGSDDWDGFWDAYGRALNVDMVSVHDRVIGGWEGGVEEGMPLSWHFDKLRKAGFSHVECFWRLNVDAIYGGIRNE